MLRGKVDKSILWCELEEVKECGVLAEISAGEKILQESIFEVLTTEASFNNAINVLQNVIFASNEFAEYVGETNFKVLKSNVDQSKCLKKKQQLRKQKLKTAYSSLLDE